MPQDAHTSSDAVGGPQAEQAAHRAPFVVEWELAPPVGRANPEGPTPGEGMARADTVGFWRGWAATSQRARGGPDRPL